VNLAGMNVFIPARSPKCGLLIGWCFARQRMIGSENGDDFRSYTAIMIIKRPHRTISVIPMAVLAIPLVAPNSLSLVATALAAHTCMLINLAHGNYIRARHMNLEAIIRIILPKYSFPLTTQWQTDSAIEFL